MDKKVYHDMVFQQKEHWWFKARRQIIDTILKSHTPEKKIKILEIGCGTGGNLAMLKRYGNVCAMEMDLFSINCVKKNEVIDIRPGWLPDNIPFNGKFDIICMFDVLEHIRNDFEAVQQVKKLIKPNGKLFLTVPAMQWLFGSHDKALHHHRRYSKSRIKTLALNNNMEIIKLSYFNFFLFPLLLSARLADQIICKKESIGYSIPNAFLNNLFFKIFSFEKYFIDNIQFPFGASILTILKN